MENGNYIFEKCTKCGRKFNKEDNIYPADIIDGKPYCNNCCKDVPPKNIIAHKINEHRVETEEDPFKFVSKILDMSLEIQMEIFPETGSTENIFKYFTYEEAKERYDNWYKGFIENSSL